MRAYSAPMGAPAGDGPDVSVIISSYQRVDCVGDAVASCLAQPGVALEIVLVDDGSTDGTHTMLAERFAAVFEAAEGPAPARAVGAPRLRYVARANGGMSPALNTGLDHARGRYVKFLDSDDELVPDALGEELRCAEVTGADVVVTAWEERTYLDGHEQVERRRRVAAPEVERGIDDFLAGRAPWTAAALYRRAALAGLRWDTSIPKSRDWAWAWDVCLSGARFRRLDIVSSIYKHHGGERITSGRDSFLVSTRSRQAILRRVEETLRRTDRLTPPRAEALCQYYYKDSKVLCEQGYPLWRDLWTRCRALAPAFRPVEPDRLTRILSRVLGPLQGVRAYVALRRVARALGLKRSRTT